MTKSIEQALGRKSYSKRRRIIESAAIVITSTLVVGVLSSIALLIYTQGSREPTVHTVVVPEGSFALIEEGQNPLDIPPTWTFYADDTLVIDNRDDAAYTLGNWVVPPKTIQSFELQPAYGGFFVCTLHPAGSITLDIQPRDYDFSLIALPTFGFGIALGVVIVIGLNVMRGLEDHEDVWVADGVHGHTMDRSARDDV
jgi:ABC-type lipoprotein release transport system permease subunit